jgi:hypothetical protein
MERTVYLLALFFHALSLLYRLQGLLIKEMGYATRLEKRLWKIDLSQSGVIQLNRTYGPLDRLKRRQTGFGISVV